MPIFIPIGTKPPPVPFPTSNDSHAFGFELELQPGSQRKHHGNDTTNTAMKPIHTTGIKRILLPEITNNNTHRWGGGADDIHGNSYIRSTPTFLDRFVALARIMRLINK
ncbi:hypothetical protein PTTG_27238 [Puccinia triticina 1-1 BBBD Race 1]|uniref:Uncharacterized protein n=1 Tax=Puccinia triticina (isolate 1-1 / race 1 (BBBD)) TaxID=630390 RepID=A0A180GMB4_PUCT1|nr:hypothetical protein PTTG_27238 [Puccinia triticina 1-1 BBBD Race 1]